ncbi:MAG: M12 family metallo-peptidase, partial [Flavobacteriales bacterium]|nr:M12 family metallo-peptidase [Flavobacteriales bacterium]
MKNSTFLRAWLSISLPAVLLTAHAQAQTAAWLPVQEQVLEGQGERRIVPLAYRTVAVDMPVLHAQLMQAPFGEVADSPAVIELPRPDGGNERFRFVRNTTLHPDLNAQFPDIITCTGTSLDRPGSLIKFDVTMHGFHAMVMGPDGDWFMDPYAFGSPDAAIVYWKRDFTKPGPAGTLSCAHDEVNDMEAAAQWAQQHIVEHTEGARAGDCVKRTYRLALACTGEYANFHGSNTQNNNKGPALAAMATTMNRVNGLFERDATLTMQLVPNNAALVFLNPNTDPYTNNNGGTMLGQNQSTCNSVIGYGNYDIGHVFSTGGGGVAYLDSPCSSNKAGGVTGSAVPMGDPFDVDYVAHEMGPQYGANHTQHNPCNRHGPAAREPGSASTIMGYAGICAPNVQNNSDALFHAYSLQEIASRLASGNAGQCPQETSSNNQPPSVTAGPNHTIPRSTPFVLTASGSDPNGGDVLSYTWEQMNQQNSNPVTHPPQPTYTAGPNFRANLPSASPARYFPDLAAVVNNETPTWEVLPSVGRTLNFRTMVRDNRAGAGCTAEADRTITVNGSAGPFVVTQPNTNVSWAAGSTQTVTWNVAGTSGSPVNCANVSILLSVDGGYTYPYTLIASTPNDGSQQVTIPTIGPTTTARVM